MTCPGVFRLVALVKAREPTLTPNGVPGRRVNVPSRPLTCTPWSGGAKEEQLKLTCHRNGLDPATSRVYAELQLTARPVEPNQ